jgi:type IV pilus assembly protein PilM
VITGVKTEYFPAAIEIGANSLKLLQLGKIKSSYKIVKAGYVALEHNTSAPELALKHSLEKLIKENQVKGELISSLPLNKINTYTYILPNMPPDEIKEALVWKVKQNLANGVKFEDISFDYVCGGRNDNKEIYSLVFIVDKKVTLDMIKFFKEFSLDLIAVEPQPYAIIEVLCLFKEISEKETVLILQLGASNSSVAIVSGGHPYLMTPLNASGNGFTEALSSYYQFDWGKAESLKISEGLGLLQLSETQNANETNCFQVLSSQLENLIIDIEHTFKYFSHQLVKSKVGACDRVILCGGSAALKSLDKFLSSKLGVPVVVFDPLDFISTHSERQICPAVKLNSAAFASALGLATKFINGGLT